MISAVELLFLALAMLTLFAVPKLTWDLAVPGRAGVGAALAFAVMVGAAWLLWLGHRSWPRRIEAASRPLLRESRRSWLTAVIVVGLALRIGWALLFPAPPVSDGASYFELAARLSGGLSYETPGGELAFWPPGYPFLLAGAIAAFGPGLVAVTLLNLVLFAAAAVCTYVLASRVAGEAAARRATLLLVLWPNLIASAGVAGKEAVIVLLLPAVLLLYLAGRSAGSPLRGAVACLAAGLAMGYATLTQPGVMLMVVAFPVWELLERTPLPRVVGRATLLFVGMAAVVLPWSFRNQQQLGSFVLVSTNGGGVFYRANNPLATGGWIQHGERRLTGYDELTADHLGFAWGQEWIRDNPRAFLALAAKKQILFLGDDSMGVYDSLRRGRGVEGVGYLAAKLVANAYWWLVWALIALALFVTRRVAAPRAFVLVGLIVLYFAAVDSVFESGSRHHLPLVALLAIVAAWTGEPPVPRRLPERT